MIDHTRHSGIFSVEEWPITLIGAGGIGAITAITLGKMGVPVITVFDDDAVSVENTATQFFSSFDVESPKVEALKSYMGRFAEDTLCFPVGECVDGGTPWCDIAAPVIISAVDSITARKQIWQAVKPNPFMWYLESRMASEVFQLYTVNGENWTWYDNMLHGQEEGMVPDEPCTSKATIYTAMVSAGHIGKTLRMIATGITPPQVVIHDILNDVITKLG